MVKRLIFTTVTSDNQITAKIFNIEVVISDESELSSARIQLELARLVGFSARLGSACGIFEPARVLDILQERAISALQNFHCWKILIT